MKPSNSSDLDRLLELLADQTLAGLNADQERELKSLLEANPDFDVAALDRAAAMLDIAASAGDWEPLPDQLRDRILAQAESSPTVMRAPPMPLRNKVRRREVLAWMTAAVCLLLAVFAWSRWPAAYLPSGPPPNSPLLAEKDPSPARPTDGDGDTVGPNAEPTIAELREQLLRSTPDVLHLQLVSDTGGGGGNESGGDIVWSSGRQIGFLRLRGLPGDNLAQPRQYQLWIVSNDVSGNEFINGGVFPVDRSTGELILPIQADQFVQQPKMFVVSVEPAGSDNDLIAPLLAKADGLGAMSGPRE